MGRKQRQIAKITKDLRNKNVGYSDSKDFADKIKHSDDYRGKRIKDGERFQSKITDKDSKLQHSVPQSENTQKRKRSRNYKFETEEKLSIGGKSKQYEAFGTNDELEELKPQTEHREIKEKRLDGKERKTENIKEKRNAESDDKRLDIKEDSSKEIRKKHQQRKIREEFKKNEEAIKRDIHDSHTPLSSSHAEPEVYDPLSKDMDNDGVIDRYDSDFRDSTISYESIDQKLTQRKGIKRKNYSADFISWKKPKDKNFKPPDIAKDVPLNDKKIQKKITKQKRLTDEVRKEAKKRKTAQNLAPISVAGGLRVAKDYLSHGSDENQGVESGEKTLGAASKLIHGGKNYSVKRKNKKQIQLTKLDKQIKVRKSKLEFREAVREIKKDKDFQKKSALKKFQKKRHMKSAIYKKQKTRLRDRIKESFITAVKGTVQFIKQRATKLGIIVGALFLLVSVGLNSCSLLGGLGGAGSSVLSSSYMANDYEITTADELLQELETDLEIEINETPTRKPGYDEYRYELNGIGHNPQDLIAYLTAKYGEFRFPDVESDITNIFNEVYKLSYREETETYTVTETVVVTDPETGASYTTEVEVEKTKTILVTVLETGSFDEAYAKRLNDEEKEHFETLKETMGNYANLHSPIVGDWKHKVSSMYGFRSDPFTNEKKFHSGLDIADSEGTPLFAVFDGVISFVGNDDDGYGKYVKLTDKYGNTALYAHCSSISLSQGTEVKKGDEVAKMGSTGRSTGSHLHFELRLEDGTRVNPYFYLDRK